MLEAYSQKHIAASPKDSPERISSAVALSIVSATAQRVQKAIKAAGLDQPELARELGLSQGTISKIVSGRTRNSRHLPRIAVRLGVSLPYLLGETDDPDLNAPPPPPRLTSQTLSLPVLLPSEDALARSFEGVLAASRSMGEAALARELAKQLPMMLGLLRGHVVLPAEQPEDVEAPPVADRERRRA